MTNHCSDKYRLDDRLAPLADRQRDLVIIDLFEQTELFKFLDDLFTRGEPVKAFKLRPGGGVHRAVHIHHEELFEVVPLADEVIVRIMCRRDLDRTRSKFGIDVFVGNDRYFAVRQRQCNRLADQMFYNVRLRD